MVQIDIQGTKNWALKSSQLLARVRKIFGKVVIEAYILSECGTTLQEVNKNLKKANSELTNAEYNSDKHLEYGTIKLLLKFQNEQLVVFNSSEWASFTNISNI